jgi:hypothetical protein
MRICAIPTPWLFLLGVILACGGCASIQNGRLGDLFGTGGEQEDDLDEPTVVAGLKEALRIGTDRTVLSTSQLDGYLANELIKIAIPEQLESLTSTLRDIGLGSQVEELEVGMNRAAEQAASEAREVFGNAITQMTIADAYSILNGGDTAATDFFREQTWYALQNRYRPIVQQKMDEIGLSRLYGQAVDMYNSLPMVDKPVVLDLDDYVTNEALTGLFTVLAQEEAKIRQDPVARTTELLRRVFGP